MVYVYRHLNSDGARELADALPYGRRVRNVGRDYVEIGRRHHPARRQLRPGDTIICWGERLAPIEGIKTLNGSPLSNKMEDAIKLRQENVPTVEVSFNRGFETRPPMVDTVAPVWAEAIEAAGDFITMIYNRTCPVVRDAVRDLHVLVGRLHTALAAPLPPAIAPVEWIPRLFHHTGGEDLLNRPVHPDYWVKKEALVNEYRVHSFLGKSIRAGIKTHREGHVGTAHPWIRSWDGGWRILYDGFSSRQRHRDIAHRAVTALGLQFGAVDIGEKADGSLIVLEVNRAPGLEGGTVTAYAQAVQEWLREGKRRVA